MAGVGAVIAGMTRQGFNVEVRQFPEGWRANFYPFLASGLTFTPPEQRVLPGALTPATEDDA